MKKLFVLFAFAGTFFIYSCGGGEQGSTSEPATGDASTSQSSDASGDNPAYDPERGKGKFTHVEIAEKLDPAMVAEGEKVYNVKCASCHKLTDEKLVGPGWKDVTKRHKPEWIMNFVTNTDEMIDKDPKVQAQLELCMVRMPNQNLSDEAARGIYEYMRKNDGVK
ncbi:MAG TPA: cytochrome c [Segetibacter sp.]